MVSNDNIGRSDSNGGKVATTSCFSVPLLYPQPPSPPPLSPPPSLNPPTTVDKRDHPSDILKSSTEQVNSLQWT